MREASAFDEFYQATVSRVVTQVYLMTGDYGEAEDAVQEAYARAWGRWHRIADLADPSAWVRTVAYRIAVSSWRRAQTRLLAHRRSADPGVVPELNADTVALVTAMREIPTAQRRAIVLHHLAGLTVREVADETGLTQSAVKAQLTRGRRALSELLGVNERTEANTGV